ncbi:MAG: hypothetical protein WBW31_18730 [Candidatus Sulfotelmatobacter sp.]
MTSKTMISKPLRIPRMIVLASLALSSAAWAATCSNASLSGTYGFLHAGVDAHGAAAVAVTQLTFDPTTGTYTGEDLENIGGVIVPSSLTATYAVAKNCTATAQVTLVSGGASENVNVSFVVTPTGFLFLFQRPGATSSGFGVKQGSPTCTNAGVEGRFGLETTGMFLASAPVPGPAAFIGELKFSLNPNGDGVISGHIAGSEDGTILTFADEPVTGSYKVGADCRGTATITPKGQPEMHFSFVVVDCGKELLAIETDPDAAVSGTLVKSN